MGVEPLTAAPVTAAEFAACFERFSPFEQPPRIAVAVSGGSDSLALVLLADEWARLRGGSAIAVTVDHGLRSDSAVEAAAVGEWLGARGITHHVLTWQGPKPITALQATARDARRVLLVAFCREQRILHLLLGHQQDDQAETLILRLAADSGRDGLAAMAAVDETPELRILRPLLDMPRARLAATLIARGQRWVSDPSNRDSRFARVAARDLATAPENFAITARDFAVSRSIREKDVAALLARSVAIYPEGWATFNRDSLVSAPPELGRRALARVLMVIGGNEYAPGSERLDRLYDAIVQNDLRRGRTLAGCRIAPRKDGLLILRECAAVGSALPVSGSGLYLWDGRFAVVIAGSGDTAGHTLRALGPAGWAALARADKALRDLPIPAAVRPTLPALWDLEGVKEVPHLLYRRRGGDPDSVRAVSVAFRPVHSLAGAGFGVLPPPRAKL
jgi:tRNA(Ile)-lysidine synthase